MEGNVVGVEAHRTIPERHFTLIEALCTTRADRWMCASHRPADSTYLPAISRLARRSYVSYSSRCRMSSWASSRASARDSSAPFSRTRRACACWSKTSPFHSEPGRFHLGARPCGGHPVRGGLSRRSTSKSRTSRLMNIWQASGRASRPIESGRFAGVLPRLCPQSESNGRVVFPVQGITGLRVTNRTPAATGAQQ